MRKIGVVLCLAVLLVSCGGGGGGGSDNSSWVGAWLIVTENGTNVSSLGATYTITENSVAQVIPGVCSTTLSVSTSGDNWSGTVQTTDCAAASPGTVQTGTFSVSGDSMTIVNYYLGTTQTCERLST